MKRTLFILLLPFVFAACRAKQAAQAPVQAVEVKVPNWVSSRPNNGFKYVGVGFAEKDRNNDYIMEAKKNALYDLASEIKVNISSNSVLYTVQNNNSFNENFNSLIKLSNSDNLEGYTLVDTYENDKQYWVLYQLDKEEYAKAKALKKQQTVTKAANLITASFYDEKNKDFSSCLKKRIQAFGVLTPYLNEEIVFDSKATNGVGNIFDLTNLIQQQLQSISVATQTANPVLKPYQVTYTPLPYKLLISGKTPLQNFPLSVSSDDDRISVSEISSTNSNGELQLRINSVEPVNQTVGFTLNPDINTLMGTDSVGRAGLTLLKQFIQTGSLKVYADVKNITLYIQCVERNFGAVTGMHEVETFIKQKFSGQEIKMAENVNEADYVIEAVADTEEDQSSAVLSQSYNLKLASLMINLSLRNRASNEVLYRNQVSDIYGYANDLKSAGLNAYANPRLSGQLGEAVFFLKRKILVY